MQDALRTSLAREGKDAVFAGTAKDDATWDALFDEIEANREATRGAK